MFYNTQLLLCLQEYKICVAQSQTQPIGDKILLNETAVETQMAEK